MKYLYLFAFFITFSGLYGCASNKPTNQTAQNLIAAHKEQSKYMDVMDSFISYAKNKDVSKMLSLTSNTTITNNGITSVKNIYEKSIIPEVNSCSKIFTHKNISIASKELTRIGTGYIYNKVCQKENGKPH